MKPNGAIPNTKSIPKQMERLQIVVNVWSTELSKPQEVITISDTNINLDLDYSDPNSLPFHDRKLTQLYKYINNKIFNQGAAVIQTKPTKIYQNTPDTWIYHMTTNYPQKNHQSQCTQIRI